MNPRRNDRSQDTAALSTRAALNIAQGNFDLAGWVGEHLALTPRSRWLDLACGTGQLSLQALAGAGGRIARFVGVDISFQSLQRLSEAAAKAELAVEVHAMPMEELADPEVLPELRDLTHITSAYGLYYAHDAQALLRALCDRLTPDGMIAVVGPAAGNNREWFDLLRQAGAEIPPWVREVGETFPQQHVLPVARDCFERHRTYSATNRVILTSAAQLRSYWRSNIYYRPERDDRVCRAIEDRFRSHATFRITKKIGMIGMWRPKR